eukprot:CAMPEP_0197671676 /NCGR_PEP_ID=MMETSP1338-20131121/77162_1 /TAXON_ID=43686 ORGANISM="Pelagodinium beii, Strain RCC1491" /NCGR_SAMPLE_ID=MMETSP1338 /ASSEMBLY_ACC=CAM_ASM_000754 /LENGTH=60 /DNA_ID=CAMNT_0043251619 /DNA_START=159 /DNA_END=338 /DNA_ORIENTATION=-
MSYLMSPAFTNRPDANNASSDMKATEPGKQRLSTALAVAGPTPTRLLSRTLTALVAASNN